MYLVRLHHVDSQPDGNPANAGSLLTTGPYPTLDTVAVEFPSQSKPLHILYPRMIQLQTDYTRNIINALSLKDDPALRSSTV